MSEDFVINSLMLLKLQGLHIPIQIQNHLYLERYYLRHSKPNKITPRLHLKIYLRESSPVSGEDVKDYILWLIINNACSEKDSALFKHARKALLDQHCDLAFIQKAKGPQYFSFWRDLGIKAGIGDILSRHVHAFKEANFGY